MVYNLIPALRRATLLILGLSCVAMAQQQRPRLEVQTRPLGPLPRGMAVQNVHVSPDGRRVAFVAKVRDKVVAVIDGVQQRKYDWIVDGRIGFTADSGRFFYQIRKGDQRGMVIDGSEGKAYDVIDEPVISPRGARIGYVAGRGNVFFPVIGGVEGKAYDNIQLAALTMRRAVCIARIGREQCLVVDGVEGNRYDRVANVRTSDDGDRIACRVLRGEQWLMVVDGKEEKPYIEIGPAAISADGSHYAYAARNSDAYYLVRDGVEKRLANHAMPAHLTFSPDGSRLAYATIAPGGNGVTVVIDDKPQGRYDQVLAIRFSPDAQRIAFVARRGGKALVIADGMEAGSASAVNPASLAFSADGAYLAWIADTGEKDVLVFDGTEGPAFDHILTNGPLAFEGVAIPFIAATERAAETALGTPDRIIELHEVLVTAVGK